MKNVTQQDYQKARDYFNSIVLDNKRPWITVSHSDQDIMIHVPGDTGLLLCQLAKIVRQYRAQISATTIQEAKTWLNSLRKTD